MTHPVTNTHCDQIHFFPQHAQGLWLNFTATQAQNKN